MCFKNNKNLTKKSRVTVILSRTSNWAGLVVALVSLRACGSQLDHFKDTGSDTKKEEKQQI